MVPVSRLCISSLERRASAFVLVRSRSGTSISRLILVVLLAGSLWGSLFETLCGSGTTSSGARDESGGLVDNQVRDRLREPDGADQEDLESADSLG